MKDLEHFIRSRKEEFSSEVPSPDHFEKFMKKLPGQRNYKRILQIAAIFVSVAFISVASYVYLGLENGNTLNAVSTEMEQTLYYYEMINLEKERSIMEAPIEDLQEKNRIKQDLKQNEKVYKQLMNDLEKYPSDQRVLNAIIEYHRSRSDLLEHILFQLKKQSV